MKVVTTVPLCGGSGFFFNFGPWLKWSKTICLHNSYILNERTLSDLNIDDFRSQNDSYGDAFGLKIKKWLPGYHSTHNVLDLTQSKDGTEVTCHLPEQLGWIHSLDSASFGHGIPSFIGFWVIARPLSWTPRPHVTEQGLHDDQRETLQWTLGAVWNTITAAINMCNFYEQVKWNSHDLLHSRWFELSSIFFCIQWILGCHFLTICCGGRRDRGAETCGVKGVGSLWEARKERAGGIPKVVGAKRNRKKIHNVHCKMFCNRKSTNSNSRIRNGSDNQFLLIHGIPQETVVWLFCI